MPRSYSDEYLRMLSRTSLNTLGIELARVCVQCNLPMAYVAVALGVSKTTIYNWFRGAGVRENNRSAVDKFLVRVRVDTEAGVLPVTGPKMAKDYLRHNMGAKL